MANGDEQPQKKSRWGSTAEPVLGIVANDNTAAATALAIRGFMAWQLEACKESTQPQDMDRSTFIPRMALYALQVRHAAQLDSLSRTISSLLPPSAARFSDSPPPSPPPRNDSAQARKVGSEDKEDGDLKGTLYKRGSLKTIMSNLQRAFNVGVDKRNRVPGAKLEQRLNYISDPDCGQVLDNVNAACAR